jgi:response regulator RpfG family c-di-GMP phosphodiesterase
MIIRFQSIRQPEPRAVRHETSAVPGLRPIGARSRPDLPGDLSLVHQAARDLGDAILSFPDHTPAGLAHGLGRLVPHRADLVAHAARVAAIASDLAIAVGLPADQTADVSRAGVLHDLGRLAFSGAWLEPGPFDDTSLAVLRLHPVVAREAIERVPGLETAALIVAASHERFDGTGYPSGLRGSEIPIGARILAIADAHDAMTAECTFSDPMPAVVACAQLVRDAGARYDPDLVRAWLRSFDQVERPRVQ